MATAEWPEDGGAAPARHPADATPQLNVASFAGPLDFLLELVRRQRLDLEQLSIVELAEQFVAALAASAGRVPLERRADWLVLASELLRLHAALLAPPNP